jgi:thiamine kinase-like enzyme
MQPANIAALALGIPLADIVATERIKHGLTNESWLVRTVRDAVVVRISNTAEQDLQIDRHSEAAILVAVAAADLGAPVLLCDPATHILVTRYLGRPWTFEDAREPANIERLAGTLRRLHALTPPGDVRTVDLDATIEGYLRALDEHGAQHELGTEVLRAHARNAAQSLQAGSVPCLCHNDAHHLNVVGDGEVRLIDWEYAGVGERLFDLASACVYHAYDAAQRERLLRAYLTTRDVEVERRLELACWLFEYVRDLWIAVRALSG